jgi:hypothetical protein
METGMRLDITISGGYQLVYGKKRLRALMRKAGAEVAALARSLIRQAEGGGRTYAGSGGSNAQRAYQGGAYVASSPGGPPVSVTGTLASLIVVKPFKSGEGVAIRDKAFYALFLQAGAQGGVGSGRGGGNGERNKTKRGEIFAVGRRVLLPRPFLSTALDMREASLGERIKASIVDDIEFKRVKVAP